MKIIISGNVVWGLCGAIYKKLVNSGHEVHCFSLSNGIDLCTHDGRERFKALSMGYDVFINCAKLNNFCQTLLLKDVWDHWKQVNRTGQIINIGSTVDTGIKGGSRLYTTEKVALKNMSRKLTYDSAGGSGIRVTYLSLGYLDTKGVSFAEKTKIKLEDVANTVEWIINYPSYININEICMDPIQEV